MSELSRYVRQSKLPQIGPEGQKKISRSSVAVVGVGALGSVTANLLARAGVGRLRLIDRDFLELQNLQRQTLYDEADLKTNLPKAVLAQRKLQRINSQIVIEAEPSDLNPETLEDLLEGIDLVIDGTDNFETRFLINDFSLQKKIPWIYGAAVGTGGLAYVILPGERACLRCIFEEAPVAGTFETCETAGILAPAAHWAGSFQAAEALKILAGKKEAVEQRLIKFDLWKNEFKTIEISSLFLCSGCTRNEFPYLSREKETRTVTLCGRNAVQILRPEKSQMDFSGLAQRLSTLGAVQYNEYLLKASIEPYEITVFQNGRAIIQGTEDAGQAKAVYSKYIGG